MNIDPLSLQQVARLGAPSFFSRYVAGEHQQVWKELIALGEEAVRLPLMDDALAVAREIVWRAKQNLSLIYDRLCAEGYRFANPDRAFLTARPGAALHVATMEAKFGQMPLLARIWYTEIESVDFRQDSAQLSASSRMDVSGLGYGTSVIMQSVDRCWDQWVDIGQPSIDGFQSFLPTGGDASNCSPMGFHLPCEAVDSVLFNDGGDDCYFVDELRTWFRWGGFPRSARYLSGFPVMPAYARPNIERLMPMLREGLYDL